MEELNDFVFGHITSKFQNLERNLSLIFQIQCLLEHVMLPSKTINREHVVSQTLWYTMKIKGMHSFPQEPTDLLADRCGVTEHFLILCPLYNHTIMQIPVPSPHITVETEKMVHN